jgi:hypothetical protein
VDYSTKCYKTDLRKLYNFSPFKIRIVPKRAAPLQIFDWTDDNYRDKHYSLIILNRWLK